MDNEAEIFKITAIDDKGNEIVSYVKPEYKMQYIRQMSSEYGNLEIVPMMIADLPDDVEQV